MSATESQAVTSTPRSKRMEASLMRSSPRLVREMWPESKRALSSSTSTVPSSISESSPPMTPASATGVSPSSVMRPMSAVQTRSWPSSVVMRSPSRAARTTMWRLPSRSESLPKSKACSGWPVRNMT